MRVAASAIDDRAGKLSAMRHHGENVSPDRRIFAPAVIDNNHASFGYFVDEITDRSGWNASRAIKQSVSASRQSKPGIERFDAQTLARNAEPVQCVA